MSNASLELGGGNWAAKDTKILGYAVGDTSGKHLPREFDFSRGADIAATRVNKDGLIEKYRENLILQSNQFDTTWSQNDVSVTSSQAGYDGTNDAWLVTKTASTNSYLRQNFTAFNDVRTFSVYAKAGTLSGINIQARGSVTYSAQFDLSDGTTGSDSNEIVSNISSVGNGWWRCSVTFDASSVDQVRIFVCTDGSTVGSTAGSIYIQDAQLERGLVATDYIETDSSTANAGVLDDLPRIDYTSGSAQLLMEPSRTNYVDQSEYFSDWTNSGATVTDNDTTSPEGLLNAAKLQANFNASAVNHQIDAASATIPSGAVSASIFAKKGNTDFIRLRLNGTSNAIRAWFDLSNGTTGTVDSGGTSSMTSMGDGWYRCTVTETGNTNTSAALQVFINESDGQTTWVADGDEYIYIYGAQLESGEFSTSYIPTYGASDTRAQDQAEFDQDVASGAWTIYMDVENLTIDSGGFTGNFFFKSFVSPSDSALFFFQTCFGWPNTSSGTSYSCGKLGLSGTEFTGKWAVTYDGVNTIKIYVDGSLESTVTDVDPNRASGISSGQLQYKGDDQKPRKFINDLKIYSKELSQSEAEALTA